MKRPRWPQQVYQRRLQRKRTAKQRIHELLRENTLLTVEQLAQAVGCPRAYARIWRKNFFALVVEGGNYGSYPASSELIFAETSRSSGAGLAEKGKDFIGGKAPKTHKFEIGKEIMEGYIVKSLRSE